MTSAVHRRTIHTVNQDADSNNFATVCQTTSTKHAVATRLLVGCVRHCDWCKLLGARCILFLRIDCTTDPSALTTLNVASTFNSSQLSFISETVISPGLYDAAPQPKRTVHLYGPRFVVGVSTAFLEKEDRPE
jgi:lipoate synthase